MSVLKALRPKQWSKNALVLAALVFSGHAMEVSYLWKALFAMLLFCSASSGLYLINDIQDVEKDRAHPVKKHRAIASGRVSIPLARNIAILLLGISLVVGWLLSPPFFLVLTAYVALTTMYSYVLKNYTLVDVFAIAVGFVLRAVAGAEAIGVGVSDWLLICTLLLALFIALCKRRHELTLLGMDAKQHRRVLTKYTPELLDQLIGIVTGATVVCYSLYTLWPETIAKFGSTDLKYSIPFVLFGIFRYLYIVHTKDQGGAPEKVLLTDKVLLIDILVWGAIVSVVIYLGKS